MKPALPLILIALALFAATPPGHAQDAAAKGLAIATEAKKRDTGYVDSTADVTMVLKNKQGQTSVRKMEVKTIETPGVGEKAIIVFSAPADYKGTALLSHSNKKSADDQWLYLQSLKRVKRIASGNKSGSFVGSEFSYEDISPQQVEKYTYKYLRDETYLKRDCFVFERYPKDKKTSGYAKQVIWMDKAEYRPWKVENYDRKNRLQKTLKAAIYKKYIGKFWRPDISQMVNHQTGKSTTLKNENFRFKTGLKQSAFDRSVLDQAK